VVTLASAAPAGGALVSLSSGSAAVTVPGGITIAAGTASATFDIASSIVSQKTVTTLSATYNGVTKTTTFLVNPNMQAPAALATLTLDRAAVTGGAAVTGTVTLTAPAPNAGAVVTLGSSNAAIAAVPTTVVVPAGATSQAFAVATSATRRTATSTISASHAGVTRTATLTVNQASGGKPRKSAADGRAPAAS
jgi:hypothetical protein